MAAHRARWGVLHGASATFATRPPLALLPRRPAWEARRAAIGWAAMALVVVGVIVWVQQWEERHRDVALASDLIGIAVAAAAAAAAAEEAARAALPPPPSPIAQPAARGKPIEWGALPVIDPNALPASALEAAGRDGAALVLAPPRPPDPAERWEPHNPPVIDAFIYATEAELPLLINTLRSCEQWAVRGGPAAGGSRRASNLGTLRQVVVAYPMASSAAFESILRFLPAFVVQVPVSTSDDVPPEVLATATILQAHLYALGADYLVHIPPGAMWSRAVEAADVFVSDTGAVTLAGDDTDVSAAAAARRGALEDLMGPEAGAQAVLDVAAGGPPHVFPRDAHARASRALLDRHAVVSVRLTGVLAAVAPGADPYTLLGAHMVATHPAGARWVLGPAAPRRTLLHPPPSEGYTPGVALLQECLLQADDMTVCPPLPPPPPVLPVPAAAAPPRQGVVRPPPSRLPAPPPPPPWRVPRSPPVIDIFIRTWYGDAAWLTLALRTLAAHVSPALYRRVIIAYSAEEDAFFSSYLPHLTSLPIVLRPLPPVWPSTGRNTASMQAQAYDRLHAPRASDADYFLHLAADHAVVAPVTNLTDLLPAGGGARGVIYQFARNTSTWLPAGRRLVAAASALLREQVELETAVVWPSIFPRDVYNATVAAIEAAHGGLPLLEVARGVPDFTDATTMGAYLAAHMPDRVRPAPATLSSRAVALRAPGVSDLPPGVAAYTECIVRARTPTTCVRPSAPVVTPPSAPLPATNLRRQGA